jgi:hypothetical protein
MHLSSYHMLLLRWLTIPTMTMLCSMTCLRKFKHFFTGGWLSSLPTQETIFTKDLNPKCFCFPAALYYPNVSSLNIQTINVFISVPYSALVTPNYVGAQLSFGNREANQQGSLMRTTSNNTTDMIQAVQCASIKMWHSIIKQTRVGCVWYLTRH